MLTRIIKSLIRKAIFLGIGLGILLIIGYFATDHKDYPGKREFANADSVLDTNSEGAAHGDTNETQAAAAEFSSKMKTLQATLFSGGSGRSYATGGNFVTYVKRTPTAVVIMCHVPELRNYKDEKTREALARIAWLAGQSAAKKFPASKAAIPSSSACVVSPPTVRSGRAPSTAKPPTRPTTITRGSASIRSLWWHRRVRPQKHLLEWLFLSAIPP